MLLVGLTANDTVVGDPLLTVPLHINNTDVNLPDSISLCYEIHGQDNTYFNLISDECTTVNAHYVAPTGIDFINVMDAISIYATDTEHMCHSIEVTRLNCAVTVDGYSLEVMRSKRQTLFRSSPYKSNGIVIRRYNNRVRLTLPNCADTSLVLWIVCESHHVKHPITETDFGRVDMLKFVVARGLNLKEYSHGLLGKV